MTTTTIQPEPAVRTTHLRVWLNDRLVDPDLAQVSALDHGLVVGDGVFEALKSTPAGPFAVRRHLDRLTRSARGMGLPDPDHGLIKSAIEAVLANQRYSQGKIRITWTGGAGPLGSQPAYGPGTLVVAADEREVASPVGSLITVPWWRNEHGALTGLKTTSYAENVRALAFACQRGAGEAVFGNTAGHLCEGTGSNVFCVFGERVVTPPLSAGPLRGITRDLVLQWCDIEEADLTVAEAQGADEVFITSSLRDVQAIDRWDEGSYPAPGPITKRIAATFAARSRAEIDP